MNVECVIAAFYLAAIIFLIKEVSIMFVIIKLHMKCQRVGSHKEKSCQTLVSIVTSFSWRADSDRHYVEAFPSSYFQLKGFLHLPHNLKSPP